MDKLISIKTLSELLEVRPSWVKSQVFKKKIPFVKVGNHIRFCPKAIQKWIEERKIQEGSWS